MTKSLIPSEVEIKSHHILSTKRKERKNKTEEKRSSHKKLAFYPQKISLLEKIEKEPDEGIVDFPKQRISKNFDL